MQGGRRRWILRAIVWLLVISVPSFRVRAEAEAPAGPDFSESAEASTFPMLPVAFYLQETSLALGGLLATTHRWPRSAPEAPPNSLFLYAFYTLKKQFNAAAEPELYFRGGRDKLYVRAAYEKWPSTFWGVGRQAGEENSGEDYERERFSLESKGLTRLWSNFRGGIGVDLSALAITNKASGKLIDRSGLTGSGGGNDFGPGLLLEWDDRDERFWPSRGGYHRFGAFRFWDALWADYDFTRYTLDLRQYVPLWPEHILAAEFFLQITDGDPPFERLAALGGPMNMRGLYAGRFRDRDAASVQLEYRFPIHSRFRGVVFASAGEVARTLSDFAATGAVITGGAGFRYALEPRDKLNLRVDLAASEFGFAPYILVNEAF